MEKINVISPVDGKVLASISKDTGESLDQKIVLASAAQVEWEKIGIKNRAHVMLEYRQLLKKYGAELSQIIHQENGKTLDEAQAEVQKSIELTEFAAALPNKMLWQGLEVSQGVTCTMVYKPLGVVSCITPFNFPLMVPHWTVPIALMAGNGHRIHRGVRPHSLAEEIAVDRSARLGDEYGHASLCGGWDVGSRRIDEGHLALRRPVCLKLEVTLIGRAERGRHENLPLHCRARLR